MTPMADDWRLTVELAHEGHRESLLAGLRGRKLANEAREQVGERVIVTHDGPRVFLYTDTEPHARAVEAIAGSLLSEHDLPATVTLARWHPLEERWEDASEALPASPEEAAAELAHRGDADRERSREQGYPEWDVRLMLPTHAEAVELEARLTAEGIAVIRRSASMIAGAETEQDAQALAERLRSEVPKTTIVHVEVNRAEAWDQTHPFAFLGGLAG
jgi:hypothetical protein